MNEEGQLEPSFGWRATHVMSLRGFQLFHLRSKRRRRLLLLPLFSLTFYTVTSFDRGWRSRGGKTIASERLILLSRLQQYGPFCLAEANTVLSHSLFFLSFFLDVFGLKVLFQCMVH